MSRTTAPTARAPYRTILRLIELETRATPTVIGYSALGSAEGAAPFASVLRADGTVLARVAAFDPAFRGGVTAAVGEFDGNGNTVELVAGAGVGGGPHVKVFAVNKNTGAVGLIAQFMAYETSFRGGVNVAAGDLNGDNKLDIIAATATLDGRFRVYSGLGDSILLEVSPFNVPPSPPTAQSPIGTQWNGGLRVGAADFNQDGLVDFAVAAGPGGGPAVVTYTSTFAEINQFFAFDSSYRGGIFVA